jgi:hypothetical protein
MSNETQTTARKPYVRYELSGDINDRGLAFSVKKAVRAYFDAQGFEGHIHDLESNNSRFTAIVEIYDNGKQDFNITHLLNHIKISGRMPTDQTIKPEIHARTIPVDANITINEEVGKEAYESTIRGLKEQLAGKEEAIAGITRALTQRQGELRTAQTRVTELEKAAQRGQSKRYSNARDAILHSYLKTSLDVLTSIVSDFQELEETENRDLITSPEVGSLKFIDYVNSACKTHIKDESELATSLEQVQKYGTWDKTDKAKANSKRLSEIEANEKLLQTARSIGVAQDVIVSLEAKVREGFNEKKQIQEQEKMGKESFDRDIRIAGEIEVLRTRYGALRRILNSSQERKELEAELPLLVELKTGDKPSITFTLPIAARDSAYFTYLSCVAKAAMADAMHIEEEYIEEERKTDGDFVSTTITLDTKNTAGFTSQAEEAIKTIITEPLTKALGAKLRITCLCSHSS